MANTIHNFNVGIYASRNVCVKDIDSRASMVLQNYQKVIVLTSNMIFIVALAVGFKCPRKIHLDTQWGGAYYSHSMSQPKFSTLRRPWRERRKR